MKNKIEIILTFVYSTGSIASFIYLTFFDGYIYTTLNWLIAIPVNFFISGIWPLYWGILRWIF
jgi:ABC-type thiamin/hydroxymethylpyrimidine transport system permease subunit